ncbi:MAG: nitroreductase family protein [Desulfovibrio sp.]|jgi:hypothetical protein|nr:nitroreductase family protein [Desulfovibrio sp.]
MKTRTTLSLVLAATLFLLPGLSLPGVAKAAPEGNVITLPAPDKKGGKPLMQVLNERKSARDFKDEALSRQDLSNLLWAAFGVSRTDGRRTAPTARNGQNVEIYASLETGVWRYDGVKHSLTKVLDRNAVKDFGGAPLTLVFASPSSLHDAMHLGSIYQNVGLYCASAGLANVVKATGVDVLKKDLKLPEGYAIQIIQSIGKPL